MSNSIRLSEKHGVNPAIPLCFFCLKPKNEIILAGKMKDDQEAPKNMVWNDRPCAECENFMRVGVIFISVKDGESGDNPYRTGGWVVISLAGVRRLVTTPKVREAILKKRVAFVEDETWDKIGLPRGEMKDGQSEAVSTNS